MASVKTLSEQEVSALLASLSAADSPPRIGVPDSVEVVPFSFAGDDMSLMGDLHALNAIDDRLGRAMRNVFQSFLRFQPRISAFPPEAKTLDEYLESLPPFVSLNTLKLEQLKGTALLTYRPDFISLLVNRYFGGTGPASTTRQNEFTPTEERVARMITEKIAAQLKLAWRDTMALDVNVIGTETNPAFIAFCEGADMILVNSFAVQVPTLDPFVIDLCYTLQSLKPIAPLLRSKLSSTMADEDLTWRDRLYDAVLNIELTVRPRIAEPSITLSQLLDLEAGMVVNIPSVEGVTLYIEQQRYAAGTLGEVGSNAAVKITEIFEE